MMDQFHSTYHKALQHCRGRRNKPGFRYTVYKDSKGVIWKSQTPYSDWYKQVKGSTVNPGRVKTDNNGKALRVKKRGVLKESLKKDSLILQMEKKTPGER